MSTSAPTNNALTTPTQPILSRGLIVLLGASVGTIAANLYYAQPLIAPISRSLGLDPAAAGLTVMLTQAGYGLGVLLLVPLADLYENRKLILSMLALAIFGLLGVALSTALIPYFAAAFALGLGASTVQVIVPYTAHFTPVASRGRVVGNLLSGLMLGIMLSRPIASLITDLFGWHAVFYFSAALMSVLGGALYFNLPARVPASQGLHYRSLLASMIQLYIRVPVLRRRAIYQAFIFGAFCLFWTASPLLLSSSAFNMSQTEIAIFALVGVAGTVAAPFAGRMADRGLSRMGTTVALSIGSMSFLLTHVFEMGSHASLACLVVGAILLDAGVSANLVFGQRSIFSLRAKYRSRLNGLYIATIFIGGAFGSSVGAWAYSSGGWSLTSWIGAAMPACALVYFGTEWLTGFQNSKRNRQ
jgi:predicted MFS family arabinose efflux permease